MIVNRKTNEVIEKKFYDIIHFLEKGDLIIFNDTKVFSARVFLQRKKTGGIHECVFLRHSSEHSRNWEVLIKKSKRLLNGEILIHPQNDDLRFKLYKTKEGNLELEEPFRLNLEDFASFGEIPIPPYLKRKVTFQDRHNYQSVFSQIYGSAASPTASLHFTESIIEKLREKQAQFASVTLHIGYGTFSPLQEKNFTEKKLHSEAYVIPEETAALLSEKKYSRLVVVGTTALRVLETVHRKTLGKFDKFNQGETDLFLLPPDKIQTADILITNFHVPDSSLLLLVNCILPSELLEKAYTQAIQEKYRFFSYGDAMMIV